MTSSKRPADLKKKWQKKNKTKKAHRRSASMFNTTLLDVLKGKTSEVVGRG